MLRVTSAPRKVLKPKIPRLTGKGAYTYQNPGPWGKIGREVGSVLGAHYGGPSGAKIGGKLGSYAHYIGRIFGSGDYATSPGIVGKNNLINPDQVPQFTADGNFVRIAHREYLCDITSSATPNQFQIQNFQINPGLAGTFPWLNTMMAGSFQQYRINGMVFEFRSTSSELTTSVNLGYVVMATDYDSADVVFSSKAQMENTSLAVSCKPSSHAIHAIECDRKQTTISELYVRSTSPPANTDIRLFDLGRFSIATGGVSTANAVLGELWISYDIVAIKPILYPPLSTQQMVHLKCAGASTSVPLGTSQIQTFSSFSDPVLTTGNVVTLPTSMPPGAKLLCIYNCVGSGATAGIYPATFTPGGGLTVFNGFINGTKATLYNPNVNTTTGESSTVAQCMLTYTPVAGVSPTITMGSGVVPNNAVSDLLIIMINANYVPSSVLSVFTPEDDAMFERFKAFMAIEEKGVNSSSQCVYQPRAPQGCTCLDESDTIDRSGYVCPIHTPSVPKTPSILSKWR